MSLRLLKIVRENNFFFFFFGLFRAASTAFGDSQARGQIGAVAAGLPYSHSNARSGPICDPHHS